MANLQLAKILSTLHNIHMIPDLENISPQMVMAALDHFLADQEAAHALSAIDVANMLENNTYDAPATIRTCLARFRPAADEDLTTFIMLINVLASVLSLSGQDGKPSAPPTGPLEQMLTENLFDHLQDNIDPDDYETARERDAAVKKVKEKWMTTPQKELKGKTPRQAVAKERIDAGHPEPKWDLEIRLESFGNLNAERHRALFEQGVAELKGGRPVEAEKLFRSLTDEDPDNPPGWGNLGLALAAQGKKKEAIIALKQALKVDSNYKLAAQNLQLISQASAQDLRELDTSRKASVLHIGTKNAADVEWGPHVSSAIAEKTPAVRDTAAMLHYLKENKGIKLTAKQKLLSRKDVRKLNSLLCDPDPIGISKKEDPEQYHFFHRDEFEYPTIWYMRNLLEVMRLARAYKGKFIITKQGLSFLKKSPREQYIELLYNYLIKLNWQSLQMYEDPEIEILQASAAYVLGAVFKNKVSSRNYIKPRANPKPVKIGETATAPRNRILEEKYLWEPLAWFGLLELTYGEKRIKFPVSCFRATPLGVYILPTLLSREIK